MKYILMLMLFASCSSFTGDVREKSFKLSLKRVAELKDRYYLIDCSVYDYKLSIKAKLPGNKCILLKNGDLVSSFGNASKDKPYEEGFKYYLSNGRVKWVKDLDVHHELSTIDDNHISMLSSKFYRLDNKRVRFDIVNIYDTSGDIISTIDTHKLRSHIFKAFDKKLSIEYKKDKKFHEIFHANSAIALPRKFNSSYGGDEKDLLVAVSFPRFAGVAIFSSHHNKIIWTYKNHKAIMTHHLNILDNGNLLFIVNDWLSEKGKNNDFYLVKDEGRKKFSSILEVNPKGIAVHQIDGNGDIHLFSKYRGGVSLTPDNNYLFVVETGWAYEINSKENIIEAVMQLRTADDGSVYRAYSINKKIAKMFINNKKLNRISK